MTDLIAVCMEQYASEIPAEAWYNLPQEIPVAEPVVFTGISNGKRNTEVQASLYDAMLAEIMCEKERRTQKFLRTHEIRNNGKAVKKDKRKSYQKEKRYSCDAWNGYDVVRHIRYAEKIRTDAEDWNIELENIAEYAMWEKINFDVETERLKALGAWLEWA